jgi:hypothetical protein
MEALIFINNFYEIKQNCANGDAAILQQDTSLAN